MMEEKNTTSHRADYTIHKDISVSTIKEAWAEKKYLFRNREREGGRGGEQKPEL